MTPSEEQIRAPLQPTDWAVVAVILGCGMGFLAPGLAHPFMQSWDESVHQTVARGLYSTFFTPHLYGDPLQPTKPGDWMHGSIWLHKPTGPFWLGAIMLHVMGITPAALRSVSLLADLAAGLAIFFLGRPVVGRWISGGSAIVYLALPWLWTMTQGYQFGDVTDCTLAGAIALAMALLLRAVDRNSVVWAGAAGAAVGAAFLCKSGLGLTPLGVAMALAILRVLRLCAGPSWEAVFWMFFAAAVVAAPWNIYCASAFPAEFHAELGHTLGHLSNPGPDHAMWVRPLDTIVNEWNQLTFAPFPVALPTLAWICCVLRAFVRREPRVVALALWMTATWGVLSAASVKVPAVAWGVGPGVVLALGLLVDGARRSWPVALAACATFLTPWAIDHFPAVSHWRQHLPSILRQTRERPGLFEGLLLASAGALAGAGVALVLRRFQRADAVAGNLRRFGVLVSAVGVAVWSLSGARARAEVAGDAPGLVNAAKDIGLALGRVLPSNAVLDLRLDHGPNHSFADLEMMFFSGHMAYMNMNTQTLSTAEKKGYHRYLVSAVSEPFAPVEGLPPTCWWRAYDAARPSPLGPVPPGVDLLNAHADNVTIIGVASARDDAEHDTYALFARASPSLRSGPAVGFVLNSGKRVPSAGGELITHPGADLAKGWFIIPALGPHRTDVRAVTIGSREIPLPVAARAL